MRKKPLISFVSKFIISGRLMFLLLLVSPELIADVISPPHLECKKETNNTLCVFYYEYRYNGSCNREKLSKLYACQYERDENPKEIEIISLDFRNRQECHGGYIPPDGGKCEYGIDCVEEDTIIVPYSCYYLIEHYLGLSIYKDCVNCDMDSEPYKELYSHHSCAIPEYDECFGTNSGDGGCSLLDIKFGFSGHSPDLIIFLFFAIFTLSGFILYRNGY